MDLKLEISNYLDQIPQNGDNSLEGLKESSDPLVHIFNCQNISCKYYGCEKTKIELYHARSCESIGCKICSELKQLFDAHILKCKCENCRVPSFDNILSIYSRSAIYDHSYPSHPTDINSNSNSSINKNQIIENNELINSTNSINSINSNGNNNIKDVSHETSSEKITSSKSFNKSRNRTNSPAHIIQCRICNKKRSVPDTLDINLIPSFQCTMNIWDTAHNSCNKPEEILNRGINYDPQNLNPETYEKDKEEFIEQLKQFHKEKQNGLVVRTPTLGRKEVDLYRLFREVCGHGGSSAVVAKEGTWAKIYRGLDNFSPTETSASFRLKKMYTKYLYEYERYIFHFDDHRFESQIKHKRLGQNNENTWECCNCDTTNVLSASECSNCSQPKHRKS